MDRHPSEYVLPFMTTPCAHQWQSLPEISSDTHSRYKCKGCGIRGYRYWRSRQKDANGIPQIVPYVEGSPSPGNKLATEGVDAMPHDRYAPSAKRDRAALDRTFEDYEALEGNDGGRQARMERRFSRILRGLE